MSAEPEIVLTEDGPLGLVTLNRPRALNALTLNMIRSMTSRLGAWASDPDIGAVVVRGSGTKAFCAGGDVLAIYKAGKEKAPLAREFFAEEYRLNRTIARFPKPYIAIIDGIVMGGGVGLSIHGRFRIAGDRTLFAMPETAIGLFPDVGAGYALPRLPGRLGLFLGLTGQRIGPSDCFHAQIATHYVPSEDMEALVDALMAAEWEGEAGTTVATEIIELFACEPGTPALSEQRRLIDRCFSAGSVEEAIELLRVQRGAWAEKTLAALSRASPTSLKITFEQLRRGATLSLEEELILEYRLSQAAMAGHDFYEGVRAMLIDRDKAPVWQPASLPEVTPKMVEAAFAPPPHGDLVLD